MELSLFLLYEVRVSQYIRSTSGVQRHVCVSDAPIVAGSEFVKKTPSFKPSDIYVRIFSITLPSVEKHVPFDLLTIYEAVLLKFLIRLV